MFSPVASGTGMEPVHNSRLGFLAREKLEESKDSRDIRSSVNVGCAEVKVVGGEIAEVDVEGEGRIKAERRDFQLAVLELRLILWV